MDRLNAPDYDWESQLGLHAQARLSYEFMHPLTLALRTGYQLAKCQQIMEEGLRLCEGRVDVLAKVLRCSRATATALVAGFKLRDLAGELRFQYGHRGPTGLGIQPRRGKDHPRYRGGKP